MISKEEHNMKKIISRGLLGIPLGITISNILALVISVIAGNGEYYAYVPSLAVSVGGALNAAALQTLLSGVLGAVFGAASLIWEKDSWSLVKQTAVYFLVAAAAMLPIAYITGWMEHSFIGFIIYTAIFAGTFLIVWLIQYLRWKAKICKLNSELK